MASYHQTIVVGNLGRDPEVRYLANGDAVCNFSVAVTESWKKDGEKKEKTTWYRVNAFKALAEICGKYLKKGSSVMVIGKMGSREWDDKEGVKRESWELTADSMQMLGGKVEEGKEEAKKPAPKSARDRARDADDTDDSGDIPF